MLVENEAIRKARARVSMFFGGRIEVCFALLCFAWTTRMNSSGRDRAAHNAAVDLIMNPFIEAHVHSAVTSTPSTPRGSIIAPTSV